jgi:pyruvate carboxylase subunit B
MTAHDEERNHRAAEGEDTASYHVEIDGDVYEVSFIGENGRVRVNGEEGALDMREKSVQDHFSLLVSSNPEAEGGESVILGVETGDESGEYRVHGGGYDFDVEVLSTREQFLREYLRAAGVGRREGRVTAPMPGLIVKLEAGEGQEVEAGEGVLVMEAMKMENEIKAPVAGRIAKLNVEAGSAVEKGQELFEIEPSE